MSDLMLHGVLNMPLPDDPTECDLLTWLQFKDRARQASSRIEELEAKLAKAVEACANVAKRMADEALTPVAREHAEQIAEAILEELKSNAR